MISSTDHFSLQTSASPVVNLSKAGAAFGAAGGAVAEIANGWYSVTLNTTDTNTLGDLAYYITGTGADDTDFVDQVSARILDNLAWPATSGRSMVVDAAGLVDANTVKVGPTGTGTAQTAGDLVAAVITNAAGVDIAADIIAVKADTAAILVDTGTTLDARIPASLVGGRMDSSVGAMAADTITASAMAVGAIAADAFVAGAINASAIATDAVTELRSIVTGTADSGSTTTVVDTERTEADTDYWKDMAILFTSGTISGQTRLITAFNAATDTITFTPATTQAVGTNTYEILTNVAAAGASAPTAAEVADAVWDEDATAHQTQGSYGQAIGDPVADTNTIYKAVVTDATGATVGVDVVAVKADTAAILVDTGTDGVVVASINANVITATSINADAITAAKVAADVSAEVADAVWDEDATAHQTLGTFGQAIGDPVADTNTIYKAVVTDATGATVGVDVVAVKADTAAILIDTAEIGVAGAGLTAIDLPNQTMDITGNITGNLSGSVGSVTGAVGSVTGSVGSVVGLTASNLDATVSSRATPAQVNTEVLDVLNVDTFAEPGQATPAATSTLAQKLGYLFKAWRNRTTQTASQYSLYNDDAITIDQKAAFSDNGTTADRGEQATGP